MPISETILFTTVFGLAIIFTVLSFALQKDEKTRIAIKIIAGICWFTLSLAMFGVADFEGTLTMPFMWLCFGIGFVMLLTTVFDWRSDKKNRWLKGLEE